MTPREKAKELLEKFSKPTVLSNKRAKQCALIAVDEIINSSPTNPLTCGYIELYSDMVDEAIGFWQQVKTEIENL